MKIVLEFTAEDFKANQNKTLEELLIKAEKKATSKKSAKKEVEEDEDEEDADDDTEEDEEDADDDTEEDDDSDIDADMIKETISAAVKAGNRPKVEALFKKYKAKTVANLKEAQYTKFYNELKPLAKKKK